VFAHSGGVPPGRLARSSTTVVDVASPVPFASRAGTIPGSIIDSSVGLLQRQTHDIVRFAMGSPAPDTIPADEMREALAAVWAADGHGLLDYGPTEGEHVLRAELPDFLERQGQPRPDPASFLITSGGMQGLDLACKLFVNPGDTVLVEAPTYTNGVSTILSYEARVLEAPVDDRGLNVDALPDLVAAHGVAPRVIYTIPNFQNPRGTTLTQERRMRLCELAAEWEAVILEDDPYGLLRFDGAPVPPIASLAPPAVPVVGVHTFSKILAPGFRVGWVVADPAIVAKMVDAKQGMDTCTNVPMQRAIGEFIARGFLDAHLDRVRPMYALRKRAMQAGLLETLGEAGRWTDPEGGFFLWLELLDDIDAASLFEVALAEGVAFIPGPAFSVADRFRRELRLCFASTGETRIAEGLLRLRRAIDQLLSRR
jgi:2-aminoadipate transaminase